MNNAHLPAHPLHLFTTNASGSLDGSIAFHTGLTKREQLAAMNYAAILGTVAFNQAAEDMMLKAGITTDRFETFAADLAISGADTLLARLAETPFPLNETQENPHEKAQEE